jgi:glycosyltransferase involved in cell wall biosynthesis
MSARRIAVVVQRYGPQALGGAESAARWVAESLVSYMGFDVHVLTSCANDYTTWQNVHPAGLSTKNGVHIHRFKVDAQRDWLHSQQETGRFLLGAHSVEQEMDWIRRQGPFCSDLLRYIAAHAAEFDAFIFFTYLYASTFFTLPLVAEKAILAPAAHDEPFIYLDTYRALLHMPRHIFYLTTAERELVQRVSGNQHIPSTVTAIGLQAPSGIDGARFRARHDLQGDFLLYGGRLSEAKNVPQLLDYFLRYCSNPATDQLLPGAPLTLALMGRAHMELPTHKQIVPLGFVSEKEKFDALQAATAVVLPSIYESLSIIVLEAWLVGTPVLVNGRSAVLRRQVQESNGGLYYTSYQEFESTLDILLRRPDLRREMGRQGRRFVATRYDAGQIMDQYRSVIDGLVEDR